MINFSRHWGMPSPDTFDSPANIPMMTCPSDSAKPEYFQFFRTTHTLLGSAYTLEMWSSGHFTGWIGYEKGKWNVLARRLNRKDTSEDRPATDEEIAAVIAFLLAQA